VVPLAGVLAFVLLEADDNDPSGNAAAFRSTQADDQRGDVDGDAVVPPDADREELPGALSGPRTAAAPIASTRWTRRRRSWTT
jgi:hypothetical protein